MPKAQVHPSGGVTGGTVVTVKCKDPHRNALMGNKEVTCFNNGSWSAEPECKKCGMIRLIILSEF